MNDKKVTENTDLYEKVCDCKKKCEPVAWGMLDSEGGIYDSICPEEHDREEGEYTIPLYIQSNTQLHPLSDEKILKLASTMFHYTEYKNVIEFARIVRGEK